VFANGVLKLLDEHNVTVALTSHFAALKERPMICVEHHHWFGCHSNRITRSMRTFSNEHSIFEREFDEPGAILTFSVRTVLRAVCAF
jgi:hypothetical protein